VIFIGAFYTLTALVTSSIPSFIVAENTAAKSTVLVHAWTLSPHYLCQLSDCGCGLWLSCVKATGNTIPARIPISLATIHNPDFATAMRAWRKGRATKGLVVALQSDSGLFQKVSNTVRLTLLNALASGNLATNLRTLAKASNQILIRHSFSRFY
jgi:hypothetical protein